MVNINLHIIIKRYLLMLIILFFFTSIFIFTSCKASNDENLVDLGNKYFIEHNYAKALDVYEKAFKEGYRSFDIVYNLGFIYYYEKKDYKKAEQIFKEGILLYPDSDTLHYVLFQLYFDIDNLPLAISEYKLAVKFGKDRVICINADKVRGLLRKQGKSDEELYNFFSEIISYNPNDYLALYEVARYDQRQNSFKKALENYNRVIKLNPSMRNLLLIDVGVCYDKLGNYKSALLFFEEAKKNGQYVSEKFLEDMRKKVWPNSE